MDRLEELIKRCDECKMHECIGCEICWSEVQAIKELLEENKTLKNFVSEVFNSEGDDE